MATTIDPSALTKAAPDKTRDNKDLLLFRIIYFAQCLLSIATFVFTPNVATLDLILVGIASLAFVSTLEVLVRKDLVHQAKWFFALTYTIVVTVLIATYGVNSPMSMLAIVAIASSGTLLGWKYSFRTSIAILGSLALSLILESQGVSITPPGYIKDMWLLYLINATLITFLLHAQALIGQEATVSALTRRQQELEDLRATLEDRVAQRTTELESMNATLQTEIEERAKNEVRLNELMVEIEETANAKGAFLANMSHEIRTPMNAVIGMTGLLLDTKLDRSQREFVETVRQSGESLLTIINDILDFSKIESGKLELEEHPYDLRRSVADALDLVANLAASKGIELTLDYIEPCEDILVGDVTRLRQVLVNLLSNAIKFTSEGQVSVEVSTHRIEGNLTETRIAVIDTGIGIPAERVSTLFDAFTQVDASTTRKFGGTGLGLAICKQLVGLMGGEIKVTSTIGEGSEFAFTIVTPWRERVDESRTVQLLLGVKALVVDDNAVNRRILDEQLGRWGIDVFAFARAEDAIHFVQNTSSPFDIALIDMQMPEIDGVELAQRLAEMIPTTPRVLLSSISNLVAREERVLFDALLSKPVKPWQLRETVTQLLIETSTAMDTSTLADDDSINFDLETKPKFSLLLAEDNVVNQKVAMGMLDKLGHRADVVSNGLEAVRALTLRPYDIVLMDVQMPELDGIEATKTIRSDTTLQQPYIIALTANAMRGDRERCIAAGMNEYVTKPIDLTALSNALEEGAKQLGLYSTSGGVLEESDPLDVADAPAASRSDEVDLEVIRTLIEPLGEFGAELLEDLVQTFLSETPPILEEMSQALETNDLEVAQRHAHSLKSSSRTLGLTRFGQLCADIEVALRQDRAEDAKTLAMPIMRQYDTASSALSSMSL